uniref:Coiled-coil domain-containing protein 174 n=1 Tax=Angiostrongylus cantonensis TaxID=6313 RepID=A0A0K0CWG7_ANGCA
LAVKKEEKVSLKKEAQERRKRISEHEAALQKEEEERLALVAKKLKEKTELYDKLSDGSLVLKNSDGLDVEFLVDFNAKVKERQENQLSKVNCIDGNPSTSSTPTERAPVIEHYVPDEERREYGVSHMKFASEEEKRQEQIKSLYDMSAETEKMRAKNKAEAEKKARARREKLNALRRRKGLTPSPEPEPELPEIDVSEIPLPIEKPLQLREQKPEREWDRGKGRYNTWIQKQRDERDEEFAPPSFYYQ